MSRFSVPLHLDHKPILAITDYNEIDGMRDPLTTDAQHLSFGISQWSNDDLSVKVLRHTNDRWSRQSEELPPHRAIDVASLVAVAFGYYKGKTAKGKAAITDGCSFSMDITMIPEGQNHLDTFFDYFTKNEDDISKRLNALYNTLTQLKQAGAF
jgi:hypothetical protein